MQIKDHSCVRKNFSTEAAHAKTEDSVSGHRLHSGTRSTNFEKFALNISVLQNRTHPGKKMKKLYGRCFGRTNCGVTFVFLLWSHQML